MEENKKQPEVPGEIRPEVEAPSMISMIKSFGKDFGKWVKDGAPATSPADYIERLTACNNCPHLIKKHMRTTTCPDDPQRWKPQDGTPKTEAEKRMKAEHEEAQKTDALERELLAKKKAAGEPSTLTGTEIDKAKEDKYTSFEELPTSDDV